MPSPKYQLECLEFVVVYIQAGNLRYAEISQILLINFLLKKNLRFIAEME